MRVVVTGGAGFIGSMLVPRLLDDGHHVRVLDLLCHGGVSLLPCCDRPGFELVLGDVTDVNLVDRTLDGEDAIVHLAAVAGFPACQRDPEDAVRANVDGTRTVLAARRPGQRMVFASTGSVYGASGRDGADESTSLSPLSLYASTKVEGEQMVRTSGDAVILRFSTAFGVSPRTRFDLLPNTFVQTAMRAGRLTLFEPQFRRSFIHVTDVAAAIQHTLASWDNVVNRTFNVGDPSMNMTKLELAQRIRRHIDYEIVPGDHGHDLDQRDYHPSFDEFSATGFRVAADMDAALCGIMTAVRLTEPRRTGTLAATT